MATVASMMVQIGADATGLRNGLQSAQSATESFASRAGSSAKVFAAGFAVAATAVGALGIKAIKLAADMEQTTTAFTTLTGSSAEAQKLLGQLADFAAKTPFEIVGLQDSAKKLLAYGFKTQQIIPMMTKIGDAVSAIGGGSFEIDRVTKAFGQMQAKGKVSAQEMNQLAELGIPVWQMLADSIGVTIPEAMKMAEKGMISGTQGVEGILAGMGSKFAGSMDAQSKTLAGLFSNAKDNATQAMIALGQVLITAFDLKGVTSAMVEALGKMKTAFVEFSTLVTAGGLKSAFEKTFSPELQVAIFALAGAIAGPLTYAAFLAGKAFLSMMAPLLPFIAIGAAVGVIAFIIYKNWEPLKVLFAQVGMSVQALGQWFVMVGATISTAFTNAKNSVTTAITAIGTWFTNLGIRISATLLSVGATLTSWKDTVVNFFTTVIPNTISSFITRTIQFFTSLMTSIKTLLPQLPFLIGEFVGSALRKMYDLTVAGITNTVTFFATLPGKIGTQIGLALAWIVRTFTSIKERMTTITTETINSVVNFFSTLPGKVLAFLTNVLNNVTTYFTSVKNTAVQKASETVSGVINFFSGLPGRVISIVSSMVSGVINWFGSLRSQGQAGASNFVNGVTNTIASLPGQFSAIGARILNYIGGLASSLYNKARNMGGQLWAGFKKGLGIGSPSLIELAFMAMGTSAKATLSQMQKLAPKYQASISKFVAPIPTAGNGISLATANSGGVGISPLPVSGGMGGSSGIAIHIGQLIVRTESDIRRIAEELYAMQQQKIRSTGGRV